MEKAKGGQLYQDRPATACTVQAVEADRPLTHVELGLGATKQQADQTAYRVQLVRDAADKPADIDAVIDGLTKRGKQVSP
jgi:hypothetical protein